MPASVSPKQKQRLDQLIAHALRAPQPTVDWNLPVTPRLWVRSAVYRVMVSQLYHGEIATAQLCALLHQRIDDDRVRQWLVIQERDELRHAAMYHRYLQRVGGVVDSDPVFVRTLSDVLAWRGDFLGQVLVFHVLLEGEAVQLLRNRFRCPLFAHISRMILRDESRHILFGRWYLKAQLENMPADRKIHWYATIRALWYENAEAQLKLYYGSHLPKWLRRHWLNRRWRFQQRALVRLGLVVDGQLTCNGILHRRIGIS